jgi:hypothetical protein
MKPRLRPPFATQIDHECHLVTIYCGRRAWEIAKPSQTRVASLAFPRDSDPAIYDWPVRGKEVLVLRSDEQLSKIQLLVLELLRQGATHVWCYLDGKCVGYANPDA